MDNSPLRDKVVARLNEITDQFLLTGFFEWDEDTSAPRWWDKRTPLVGHQAAVRKYVRCVARELKRPFVTVDVGAVQIYTPGTGWKPDPNFSAVIHIPSAAYTAPLRSALLLVAVPVHKRFDRYKTQKDVHHAVTVRHECRVQEFVFYGLEGKVIYDKFRQQCQTDPRFRRALRLPLTPDK